VNSLAAIGRDQVVESIDFSVDGLKRVLAYVVLLTLRYVLACYSRFIKLATIDTAAVVVLQFAILCTCKSRFKPRCSHRELVHQSQKKFGFRGCAEAKVIAKFLLLS